MTWPLRILTTRAETHCGTRALGPPDRGTEPAKPARGDAVGGPPTEGPGSAQARQGGRR
jgi:hypothetical protein